MHIYVIFNTAEITMHPIYKQVGPPYKRFQSQGHVKKKTRPTVVASLMLVACLVVKII